MSRATEIYAIEYKTKRVLQFLKEDTYNGEIITRYYHAQVALGNSPATTLSRVQVMKNLSSLFNASFQSATKEQIEELVTNLEKRKLQESTKRLNKFILKSFFAWLKGYKKGTYPPEVEWIPIKRLPPVNVRRKDLITPEEIIRISSNARSLRDRAFIQVLADSGCRIGEILPLRIEDVEFDETGATLYTDGKTGKWLADISWSAPILSTWLDNHPFKENPNAPVWVARSWKEPKQWKYRSAHGILQKCIKRAGITKRVYFHLLKHSSATLAAKKLSYSELCLRYHWKLGSPMPGVYVHMSREDLKDIRAKLNGDSIPQRDVETFPTNRDCIRCSARNAPDSKFCSKCGLAFESDVRAKLRSNVQDITTLLDKLMEDPKRLEKLLKLIEKL